MNSVANRTLSTLGLIVIACLLIYYIYNFVSNGSNTNSSGFHTSSFTNGLFFGSTGNVGLGTNVPGYKLDVLGDVNYSGTLYRNGVIFREGVWNKAGNNINYTSGRVGIGNSSAVCPLHVTTTSNAAWNIGDGLRVGGSGASQGYMQLGCDPSAGRGWIHTFMNGASGEGSGSYSKLCLQSAGGVVGIGTTNPLFPLHVVSVGATDSIYQFGYLNTSGAGTGGSGSSLSSFTVQAKFSGTVHADLFRATSDERIKKNISEINDGEALERLRSIQPKKYQYVDTVAKGEGEVYGFIAQEVRQVFPEAVALDRDYVPDVYKLVTPDMTRRRLNIPNSRNGIIKIIGMKGPKDIQVTALSGTVVEFPPSAILAEDLKDGAVFVYGYEVDDFHCMKKDFLWAINFAASQEMDRQIQELKAVTDNLRSRVLLLEQK